MIFFLKLTIPGNKAQNYLARIAKVSWLHLTKAIFYGYFPRKVFIRYDPRILEKNRNVVISNHLTEYDWFFVSSVLHNFGRFEDVCIILKMSLRDIPLLGYGMSFFQFIFLNRKVNKDAEILKSGISRLKRKGKYDLLLFPEGTYIDKVSHPKSKKWSSEAKIKINDKEFNPEEVIIPRTTGFKILRENMGDHMEGILDMTMIGNPYVKYPNDIFTYWDIVVNRSYGVNFIFFLDYIPENDRMDSDNFLPEIFERKERMISKYKEMNNGRTIDNMIEFKNIADELIESEIEYEDTVIDLNTPWAPLFHIVFILNLILIIGSFVRLFSK